MKVRTNFSDLALFNIYLILPQTVDTSCIKSICCISKDKCVPNFNSFSATHRGAKQIVLIERKRYFV
jgi:hypothetical protein